MLLSFLSSPLDVEAITGVFARNSLGPLSFALVLAISLNNQQVRELPRET
mgnify:CR=1 FL=1